MNFLDRIMTFIKSLPWKKYGELALLPVGVLALGGKVICEKSKRNVKKLGNVAQTKVQGKISDATRKYHTVKKTWSDNGHFTLFFVPANGQNVTKKHVKRRHLKIAGVGIIAGLMLFAGSVGYFSHRYIQQQSEMDELKAFQKLKGSQELQIAALQKITEANQKKLAEISKLEDQIRESMKKNGMTPPPKTDASKYGGQGGDSEVPINKMDIMYLQKSNVNKEATAKAKTLQRMLDTIDYENERKNAAPNFYPTSGGVVTSGFGGRANPFNYSRRENHPGIDIAGDYGYPIYAAGSGYVVQSEWYYGYGNFIKIDHGYGYTTAYGHMSELIARPGERVKKGQLIGRMGSTGYSTGPHLHFELRKDGQLQNPATLWQ
ncbi:MAG: M23 family metallopeptidase [Phascolarctobacterium sp.]|nr:M23 family metallopeptidase [Phascolarctobacterium sp.]